MEETRQREKVGLTPWFLARVMGETGVPLVGLGNTVGV